MSTLRARLPTLPRRAFSTSPAARSQIGKLPVTIPAGVTLHLPALAVPPSVPASSSAAKRSITITGPLGESVLPIPKAIVLHPSTAAQEHVSEGATLALSVLDQGAKAQKAVWGLTRALLANGITGVSEGYRLPLRLVGVGYRATVEPIPESLRNIRIPGRPTTAAEAPTERLNLKLGYAHPVYVDVPVGISVATPAPTRIVLSGTDKQRLGLFAAKIRRWRRPEPYRGKGIFVGDETIKLKEIKKK